MRPSRRASMKDYNIVWEKSHDGQEYAKSAQKNYNPPSAAPHPTPLTSSGRCRALGLQKPPIFLLWMAAVDDGRCRPYVAEWADASPMRYGLPM